MRPLRVVKPIQSSMIRLACKRIKGVERRRGREAKRSNFEERVLTRRERERKGEKQFTGGRSVRERERERERLERREEKRSEENKSTPFF